MEFVKRDLNAPINIRRCALLKTRPAELTRSKFVGQPLMPDTCRKQLKLMAGSRSEKAGRRL
jgi:hypothetical protein